MYIHRITSTPISSAAIWLIEALEPPISGLPSVTLIVPSKLTLRLTQVLPPKLNQKPHDNPLPWFGFRGAE